MPELSRHIKQAVANLGLNKISVFNLEMSKLQKENKKIPPLPLFDLHVSSGKLIPPKMHTLRKTFRSSWPGLKDGDSVVFSYG